MTINFSKQRWQQIKKAYDLWWNGQLDRPLIQAIFTGRDPDRAEPELADYPFTSFYDLSVPAEAIVDRWDYRLSCQQFAADAFPCVCPNFGPGVIAAFLGAELKNGKDTVWFHSSRNPAIKELHFEYNPDSPWLARIKDIYRAAVRRWEGLVQLSMTDLGGCLDILSTFSSAEQLLLDLYDNPQEVKRLAWELHDCWFQYYQDIENVIRPTNPGYSAWAGIYSAEPYYMLQCDLSYMISPKMFDEFVKPELTRSCDELRKSFYHLDGVGALPHLDSLLGIPGLDGIQWVPGAGHGPPTQWLEVFHKIRGADKLLQLVNIDTLEMTFDLLEAVINQLGSGKGLIARVKAPISQQVEVMKTLDKFDVS